MGGGGHGGEVAGVKRANRPLTRRVAAEEITPDDVLISQGSETRVT